MPTTTANYFFGTDTYGKPVEVAIREDGVFFCRSKAYNGYGMAWGKWQQTEPEKVFTDYSGNPAIKWGFNQLTGYYKTRIKLPTP